MGALYYHFRDKRDLFRAVFEEVEGEFDEIARRAAMAESDPWSAFIAGCLANVDACRRPDIHQICMLDAPSVLGWETWREIDGAYAMKSMRGALRRLMREQIISEEPTEPLAALLVGALNEAGMTIAHAHDPEAKREEVVGALIRLFDRLKVPQQAAP
jgi:AcrR family transcriptional regulator